MEIIYYGHACFGFKLPTATIIVDPFISANPLAKDIELNSIKVDYIFLTHAHYDHILDVETIAKNNDATILANFEIAAHYEKLGYKTIAMNIGGVKKFDFGRVKMTTAIHSSSFPDGSYGGHPCGFLMKLGEKVVYLAGDTAVTREMKNLPFIYGYINVAILPVGNIYTMGVHDATTAAKFLGTRNVIGSHYDTFPPIEVNKEKAKKIFLAEEREITFLEIGKSINIDIFI